MKFKKTYIIPCVLSFLYTFQIFDMYFSTHPRPPFYQIPVMLVFGYVVIFIVSIIATNRCKENKRKNNSVKIHTTNSVAYHRQFNVAGVTHECGLDRARLRRDIIDYCGLNDKLYLQSFTYDSAPAYYIVLEKNNLDIGCVPANLVRVVEKYKDKRCEIKFVDIHYFTPEDGRKEIPSVTVQFIAYKD